ncbi:hypothetical protein EYF80_013329 [Liparis tanakae]|uniref:Uncharacterized protein n=1 Tax=Liparis tanakae TaxID=230148 RepID=A0A4Z2IGA9_9TELE|nr:hypothetical protein EYF80_013329 [Liparis tanakae]
MISPRSPSVSLPSRLLGNNLTGKESGAPAPGRGAMPALLRAADSSQRGAALAEIRRTRRIRKSDVIELGIRKALRRGLILTFRDAGDDSEVGTESPEAALHVTLPNKETEERG